MGTLSRQRAKAVGRRLPAVAELPTVPVWGRLLAIDPSSTRTGYAVFDCRGGLLEAGVLRPVRGRDKPNARISAMAAAMEALVTANEPNVVVIEDTSGKVGKRHGAGGGAGLAVHGKAVGYLLCTAERLNRAYVVPVLENEWTRGKAKAVRQDRVARLFPRTYDPAADKGGDIADAIGLGLWYLDESKVRRPAGQAAEGQVQP